MPEAVFAQCTGLAVAGGKVFMSSDDNISGRSLVYAMGLPG